MSVNEMPPRRGWRALAGLFEEAWRRERRRRFLHLALLAVAALVLIALVTRGGSGTGGEARGGASGVPRTTASNHAVATVDARRLLADVRVPPGSTLGTSRDGPELVGLEAASVGGGRSAFASRTWLVKGSLGHALRYVEARLPPGSSVISRGSGSGPDESEILSWPAVPGVLIGRWLELQAYSTATHTYLNAQAQIQWAVTRDPAEVIPADVTRIALKVTAVSGRIEQLITVTRPEAVRRVVALYNSLGVTQSGVEFGCQGGGGTLSVTFLDSRDHIVAGASSADVNPPWPASVAGWLCFPITLKIHGHTYPSLSGDVVGPLQSLLHTRLTAPPS